MCRKETVFGRQSPNPYLSIINLFSELIIYARTLFEFQQLPL